jgi:hypothetical protein
VRLIPAGRRVTNHTSLRKCQCRVQRAPCSLMSRACTGPHGLLPVASSSCTEATRSFGHLSILNAGTTDVYPSSTVLTASVPEERHVPAPSSPGKNFLTSSIAVK